jgi:hypothetical protein
MTELTKASIAALAPAAFLAPPALAQSDPIVQARAERRDARGA